MALNSEKATSAPAAKTREKLGGVRWTRSGLYSWVNSKRLPRGRAFAKIRRELTLLREDLIRQHGGEKITPAALILVDSIVEALGVQKLLGLYIELNPILAKNWISYGNTVRQALIALKEITAARKAEEVLSPLDIAELIDAENAEKAMKTRGLKQAENVTYSSGAPEVGGRGDSKEGGIMEGEP